MIHRRLFLRRAGSAAAVVVLAGCSRGTDGESNAADTPSAGGPGGEVARVAPDAEQSLSVVAATFEQLTGEDQPFAFGLRDADNAPVERDDSSCSSYHPPASHRGRTRPSSRTSMECRWASTSRAWTWRKQGQRRSLLSRRTGRRRVLPLSLFPRLLTARRRLRDRTLLPWPLRRSKSRAGSRRCARASRRRYA